MAVMNKSLLHGYSKLTGRGTHYEAGFLIQGGESSRIVLPIKGRDFWQGRVCNEYTQPRTLKMIILSRIREREYRFLRLKKGKIPYTIIIDHHFSLQEQEFNEIWYLATKLLEVLELAELTSNFQNKKDINSICQKLRKGLAAKNYLRN